MVLFAHRTVLQNITWKLFNPSIRHSKRSRIMAEVSTVLTSRLDTLSNFSHEDWKKTRETLVENCPSVTAENVDSVIVNVCFSKGPNIDSIKNYYNFLQAQNIVLDESTEKKFARIFQNKQVRDLYRTDKWEMAKSTVDEDLKGSAVWLWISAAFRNGKHTMAWEYLNKATEAQNTVSTDCQKAYLETCREFYRDQSVRVMAYSKMLKHLQEHCVQPFLEAAEAYQEAFEEVGWDVEHAEMKNRTCTNCGTLLKLPSLKENDCETLLEIFKEKIISEEILDTERFREFEEFLKTTGPYEYTIDVLNTITNRSLEEVKFLIQHLANYNRKVFFITQSSSGDKNFLSLEHENVHTFHIDNKKDDSLILYAALWSGPRTKIITIDLLRDHKPGDLGTKIRKIFKKWQVLNQLKLAGVNMKKNQVILERVIPIESVLQEDKNGWHIPYSVNSVPIAPESYTVNSTWLCLRKPKFEKFKK